MNWFAKLHCFIQVKSPSTVRFCKGKQVPSSPLRPAHTLGLSHSKPKGRMLIRALQNIYIVKNLMFSFSGRFFLYITKKSAKA